MPKIIRKLKKKRMRQFQRNRSLDETVALFKDFKFLNTASRKLTHWQLVCLPRHNSIHITVCREESSTKFSCIVETVSVHGYRWQHRYLCVCEINEVFSLEKIQVVKFHRIPFLSMENSRLENT